MDCLVGSMDLNDGYLWTISAGRSPRFQKCDEFRVRDRYRRAASPRAPAPAHQGILVHVLDQLGEASIPVPRRIFEDPAEVTRRKPEPPHAGRRQSPVGRPRNDRQIAVLVAVTGVAARTHGTSAIGAPVDHHLVQMVVVALKRPVVARVAIHASRMLQHARDRVERMCRLGASELRARANAAEHEGNDSQSLKGH